MARTSRTAAVLLRAVAYGDADRIVTLLTESHGKVGLMARGARKSRKRFAGALEPYSLVEAELALGRGDLGRLAEARVVRAFPKILASLERMAVAAAGLELVREVVPDREVPDQRLLPTVVRFFELLDERDDPALRVAFSLRLLALTGFGPNLSRCGVCAREAPVGRAALFDPALGSIVCRACGGGPIKLGGRIRAAMLAAFTSRWDGLEGWGDGGQSADALDRFLTHHLAKKLAGADLLSQVREVRDRSDP